MSLFDALTNDAALSRPVMQQNYYIALRSDGAKGSDTEDDPWNESGQANFDSTMNGGPHYQASMGGSVEDLIVRDNLYSNVRYGIHFTESDAARLIVEDNLFDVFPDASAYGMLLSGMASSTSLLVLVVRGNRIRGAGDQPLTSGAYGIHVTNTNNLTLENNIVDSLPSNSVYGLRVSDCASIQVFSNRRINGDLAQVLNTNTGLFLHELTTDAEDVLLSL